MPVTLSQAQPPGWFSVRFVFSLGKHKDSQEPSGRDDVNDRGVTKHCSIVFVNRKDGSFTSLSEGRIVSALVGLFVHLQQLKTKMGVKMLKPKVHPNL